MSYAFLSAPLHPIADAAKSFCRNRWGISPAKINTEKAIASDMSFAPTLSASTADHYHLCIEVSTRAYVPSLDGFVLDCKNRGLPVKLYMAISENGVEGDFRGDIARATEHGVGIIELTDNGGKIRLEALALSLTGLRPVNTRDFPARYRQALTGAEHTFRHGDPSKACGKVYDEIESLSRRLANRAQQRGWWKNLPPSGRTPSFSASTPWYNVMKTLMQQFDNRAANCPELRESTFAAIMGMTSHRNDSGHKPATTRALQRRDRELRTRFETAIDQLDELIRVTRPLRL